MTQLALIPHDGRTRAVSTDEEHDVYAGRPARGIDPRNVAIGATGWLGNPFDVREHGKDASMKFELYFFDRVNTDPPFRRAVLALAGKRLGCPGCVTGAEGCHARLIASWVESKRGES